MNQIADNKACRPKSARLNQMEGFVQQMRGVLPRREFARAFEVVPESRPEGGMCRVIYHDRSPLLGRETAQIGEAVLRYQNLHVMLGMVDMRHHRDDG